MHPNTFARFIRSSKKIAGKRSSKMSYAQDRDYDKEHGIKQGSQRDKILDARRGINKDMPTKVTKKLSRNAKAAKNSNLNKTPAVKTDNYEGVHATSVKRAALQHRINNKPMKIRKVTTNRGK